MSFDGIDELGFSGENRGGGLEMYLLPVASVNTFPKRSGTNYLSSIVPVNGDNFVKIRFTQFTSNLFIRKRLKDKTEVWDHTIRGDIPKQRFDVLQKLYGYNNNRFVCVYVNLNGEQRVLGTPEDPLFINWDEDCGVKAGDSNSYTITLTWTSPFPAPFYEEELSFKRCAPVDIFVDGVFFLSAEPGTTVNVLLNNAFNLEHDYEDPSASHTLIELRPHTFSQNGSLDGTSSQSASITAIEYSFNGANYQPLNYPLAFTSGQTLHQRITKTKSSTSGFLVQYGTYS